MFIKINDYQQKVNIERSIFFRLWLCSANAEQKMITFRKKYMIGMFRSYKILLYLFFCSIIIQPFIRLDFFNSSSLIYFKIFTANKLTPLRFFNAGQDIFAKQKPIAASDHRLWSSVLKDPDNSCLLWTTIEGYTCFLGHF